MLMMLMPMTMVMMMMMPRECSPSAVRLKPFASTVNHLLFYSRHFGLHASMSSASPWFLNRLLTPLGENRLEALFQTVVLLSQHPTLATAVEDISRIDRKDFKDQSNLGCVYRGGKPIDIGNYRYCMLYQLICRQTDEGPLLAALREMWCLYSSTSIEAPPSYKSIEMKGDVVELVLAYCRLTGPNISPRARANHISFNQLCSTFDRQLDDLFRLIYNNGDGPPTVGLCPPPDNLVCTFFWAMQFHRSKTDALQQQPALIYFYSWCFVCMQHIGTWSH